MAPVVPVAAEEIKIPAVVLAAGLVAVAAAVGAAAEIGKVRPMAKLTISICLMMLVSGCAVTKYNPKTGEVERARFLTDSDIQGFLAETQDGTHIEFESASSDTSESIKALAEIVYKAGVAAGRAGVEP